MGQVTLEIGWKDISRSTTMRAIILGLATVGIVATTYCDVNACASFSSDAERSTKQYVIERYNISKETSLTLLAADIVEGSCYRRLTYKGRTTVGEWKLVLYLSPDLRFLSSDLLDTSLNPIEERRRREEALMRGLATAPNIPTIGDANAKVTIVEFGDFECPFCRQLDYTLAHEV